MENRWLPVEETCEYLGISLDTGYIWLRKKALPDHKIRRPWKFKRTEADVWARSCGAETGSQESRTA